MRKATAALVLVAGLGCGPALADEAYDACVAEGETNAEYRECGGAWVERADAELNEAWKALRDFTTPETGKLLLDEQRAWNAYKEKSCLFWATGEYGTNGSALSYPACRAAAIEARTTELGRYLDELKQH